MAACQSDIYFMEITRREALLPELGRAHDHVPPWGEQSSEEEEDESEEREPLTVFDQTV